MTTPAPTTTNPVLVAADAQHQQSLVDAAVAQSGKNTRRRKLPKHKFTAEDNAKFKALNDMRRKSQRHFTMFPAEDVRANIENGRAKAVMADPKTKIMDPRSPAVMGLAPFLVAESTNLIKEGNAGKGSKTDKTEAPTKRGDAKRSLGLRIGQIDPTKPIDQKLRDEQNACVAKAQESARQLLRDVYTSGAARLQCAAAVTNVENIARMKVQAAIKEKNAEGVEVLKYSSIAELTEAEQTDKLLAARVQEEAREQFVTGGKIPFGSYIDPKSKKKLEPMMWVENKVWTMEKDKYEPGKQDREKGPTVQQIASTNENIPRLKKMMAAINYVWKDLIYEVFNKETHEHEHLPHPIVEVPDLDEYGNKIVKDGQVQMVAQPRIEWDPLFVSKKGKKLSSLVQVDIMFAFTDGGKKGKYGVKAILFGPIKITAQGPRIADEKYEYDEEFATGVFEDDDDSEMDGDGYGDDDEHDQIVKEATSRDLARVSTTGLIGAAATTAVLPVTVTTSTSLSTTSTASTSTTSQQQQQQQQQQPPQQQNTVVEEEEDDDTETPPEERVAKKSKRGGKAKK